MRYDRWSFKSKQPDDIFKKILEIRGVTDIEKFLNPSYDDLIKPDVFSDMKLAVMRVQKAHDQNERVGVFMDYDADGVCGGAILYNCLKMFGIEPIPYVPERTEGYGLNEKAVDFFIQNEVKLLLTVDCGIKNHQEIKKLKNNAVDTIIIDHHQLDERLPDAVAIIHPKLLKIKKEVDLSGGATAFIFAKALLHDEKKEKWLLDLAAISLIADVVPVVSDGRIIAKYGLIVLNKTRNLGLREIYKTAEIQEKKIDTYDVGFIIAPRLNAAGRVAHPKDAFNLLISSNEKESTILACKLDKLNSLRQDKLLKGIQQADAQVIAEGQDKENTIVIRGEWDEGIIGLIASKLCEKYYRPAIVVTKVDGMLKGSARSIKSVNVTDLIGLTAKRLRSFGGHVQAAGLSLDEQDFDFFYRKIKSESKKFDQKLFEKVLEVDALVRVNDITMKLAHEIDRMKPFGVGNSRPIFALEKMQVTQIKKMGKDERHMKICASDNGISHQCLAFDYANKNWFIESGDIVDIAFTMSINEWRGRQNLDLIIEDVKKS